MRTIRLLGAVLLMTVFFAACDKKRATDDSTTCAIGSGATSGWRLENLNKNYTVELPAWYTGGGYIVYQGDYFIKYGYSTTDTIKLIAQYGTPNANTNVYGTVLTDAAAESVDVQYNNLTFSLRNKKRLCSGDKTIGYYYYTLTRSDPASRNAGLGIVYLLDNTTFKQSIIIDFPAAKEYETTDIASTIKQK